MGEAKHRRDQGLPPREPPKPLYVAVEDAIQTAFGPKLCEALGVIPDPTVPLPDVVRGIIQRHRAKLAQEQTALCMRTRMLDQAGQVLEVITETRTSKGTPLTICGLSTEWTTLTGEAPPPRPGSSN